MWANYFRLLKNAQKFDTIFINNKYGISIDTIFFNAFKVIEYNFFGSATILYKGHHSYI